MANELRGWDEFAKESLEKDDRTIVVPIGDKKYECPFPPRKVGEEIGEAFREGDIDTMIVKMLGEEAGNHLLEVSADVPAYVLDGYLNEIMKKFKLIEDDEDETKGKSPKPRSRSKSQ